MTFEEELKCAIFECARESKSTVENTIIPIIDRWCFRKPVFEDGEPVQFGDTVKFEDRVFDVDEVRYGVDNTVLMQNWEDEEGGIWRFNDWECVEHPKPSILAADGLPLEVGQTVYYIGLDGFMRKGEETTVKTINDDGTVTVSFALTGSPKLFTHTKPTFDADGVVIHEGDELWPIDDSECTMCNRDTSKPIRYVGESRFAYINKEGMECTGFTDFANVTHERPDSLDRIREDAKLDCHDYATKILGNGGCSKHFCEDCDWRIRNDLIDRTVKVMERGQ